MEQVRSCPLCTSSFRSTALSAVVKPTDHPLWRYVCDIVSLTEFELSVRFCLTCGLFYRDPVWDERELFLLYSQLSGADPDPLSETAILNNTMRAQTIADLLGCTSVPALNGENRRPRILDIGGQDGFFVQPFADADWDVYVSDLAALPLRDSRMSQIEHWDSTQNVETFDRIVLSHTLEHVGRLLGFLEAVDRVVAPGGMIYVEVPYDIPDVLWLRIVGDPGHLYYFTPATLRHCFRKLGWEVARCKKQRSTYNESIGESVILVACKPARERTSVSRSDADLLGVVKGSVLLWPVLNRAVTRFSRVLNGV